MIQKNIVDQLIQLTQNNQIDWRNYKDANPKYQLPEVDYQRIRILSKYPKRVMPVRDGYNKYQSYYAFHDDLLIAVTKGKRDDRIILIVGQVTPQASSGRRPQFDTQLAAFTDENTDNKVSKLHQLIHQPTITSDPDVLGFISDQLL